MTPADQLSAIDTPIIQYVVVLLALGGVLVLAYVTLKIGLPRMFGMQRSSRGPIQVVARYPLEPKKTLYLVKAGSQYLLIGTSENNDQYLAALAPENAAEMLESVSLEQPPRKDFRQFLQRFQKSEES
jgi:flagellar protein FliO/FliZ